MKNLFKILISTGLMVLVTACGAVQDPYRNNDQNRNGNVYRANDGVVYRRGEVYRDRNGTVYQNGRVIKTGDVYGNPGILTGNRNGDIYYPRNNRRNLPPGQAKKVYGGKATDYAKGQQKKRNNQWKKYDHDRDNHKDRNHKEYKKYNKNSNKKYKNRDDD